ncbi:MAG: TRAP transporter substrate-binding protein DctP [Burkholderiaceae bacterium]
MKPFKTLLAGALTAVTAGIAFTAPAPAIAADQLVITMDTPPAHLRTRMIKEFIARMEKASGGKMSFKLYDSSQLYASRDAAKAVARGDAGMTVLVTPYLSRVVSDINVVDLPMLNGMTEQQRTEMLDGPLGKLLTTKLEKKMGVVVPGNYWSMGKVMLFSTKKPLTQFSDLKGMKVRIPGGAAVVARLEAVGASTVSMPSTDLPLALQQGVVDGTMSGAEYVIKAKLTDAGITHGFWDQGIIGFLIPLVNQKYWKSLSADQKSLFTKTWNEVSVQQRAAILSEEAQHWKQLEAAGVKVTSATDADVARANKSMLAVQDAMIKKLGISDEAVKLAGQARK